MGGIVLAMFMPLFKVITVLGAGSNVIAPDAGLEGIVLKIKKEQGGVEFDSGNRVRARFDWLISKRK